jgi:hypothetical protein
MVKHRKRKLEFFWTYMVVRTGRTARRGDKDELVFRRLLLGRGRRLCENDLGSSNVGNLLLRICSLLKGIVVRSDLVLVLIPWAGRRFLGG